MTQPTAIRGTYSDLRLIKGRKVWQMVIEVPSEEGSRLVDLFGLPQPDKSQWVAVAPLNPQADYEHEPAGDRVPPAGSAAVAPGLASRPTTPEAAAAPSDKPRRPFESLPPSQQAALMADNAEFRRWLRTDSAGAATDRIKDICVIKSRRELDVGFDDAETSLPRRIWAQLLSRFSANPYGSYNGAGRA